jgi:hypothetical protein
VPDSLHDLAHQEATLVLKIEVPGFYVDDIEEALLACGVVPDDDNVAEQAEISMALASEDVGLTFAHYEGDSPDVFVKAMDGRIVGIEVKRG